MKKRILPFLMLHDEQLYKSKKFQHPTYIGDPIIAMKIFNEKEAEEVAIVDIDPSRTNQAINFQQLKDIASEAFMPLSYGGGINTIQQAEKLLYIGIEKLIVNTATLKDNGNFIKELVNEFGSSTIVGSVDYKIHNQQRLVYTNGGQKNTNIDAVDHIKMLLQNGIGELLINSIDCDGMMEGMDLSFIEFITKMSSTPIIAAGGVGNLTDIKNGFVAGADAIAAGSLFVFKGHLRAVLINYPEKSKANELRNCNYDGM